MKKDKIDTQFMKGTVAAVLVRACSEAAASRPEDPVQFVAGWLHKYVENDGILIKHAVAKTAAEEDAEADAKVRAMRARRTFRAATGDHQPTVFIRLHADGSDGRSPTETAASRLGGDDGGVSLGG